MLLRNLSPEKGLCNGTRLLCKSFSRNLIVAEIATGPNLGEIALIPRITLTSTVNTGAVQFQRCQFPVKLAFGMTINKAQGQTLEQVGLYLRTPVFSHGQLYVALSRVRTPSSIKILLGSEATLPGRQGHYTANIVFQEVL